MTQAAIALGGNVGDVPRRLADAAERLRALPLTGRCRLSRVYRTRAMGANAGGDFLNAVALLKTGLSPEELLQKLLETETALGRVRTQRWGPRTLDLDLLSHGDSSLRTPQLILPHAACWQRRFVLDPWNDVAPDWRHPLIGETVSEMRSRLLRRPLRVAILAGPESAQAAQLADAVQRRFPSEAALTAERDADHAEIVFTFAPSGMLRQVCLAGLAAPIERAADVLQAALEEPVPLSEAETPESFARR